MSMLPSILVQGAAAAFALTLTRARPISASQVARNAAAWTLALAVGVQSAHFAEETVTGLHERLPALLGLAPMPFSIFVTFNLAWLGIWTASVFGVRFGRPTAFFAAWFLAIGAMFNGVAHPLLALAARAYFPGLVTSPLIGIAGVVLWMRLRRATQPAVLA